MQEEYKMSSRPLVKDAGKLVTHYFLLMHGYQQVKSKVTFEPNIMHYTDDHENTSVVRL